MKELSIINRGRIESFKKKFLSFKEHGHYEFACHAAFPLLFTPDLLYNLWLNFYDCGDVKIKRIVVSDFLLSSLCKEIGHELYEMETEVRDFLLSELVNNFGETRKREVAAFLLSYSERRLVGQKNQDLQNTFQWLSLAVLSPRNAIKQVKDALENAINQNDQSAAFHIFLQLESLEKENKAFEILRILQPAGMKDTNNEDNIQLPVYTTEPKEGVVELLRMPMPKLVEKGIDVKEKKLEDNEGKIVRLLESLKSESLLEKKQEAAISLLKLGYKEESNYSEILFFANNPNSKNQNFDIRMIKKLDLKNYNLVSLPNYFSDLINLEHLDLSYNKLTSVEINGLARLVNLDITFNALKSVRLINLGSLINLNLNNNSLDRIEIIDSQNLENLNLSYNQIKAIKVNMLATIKNADLSNNSLDRIPKIIYEMRNLVGLSLYHNQLKEIPKHISNLKNITSLNLGFNKLNNASFLKELKALTSLDLRFNRITDVGFLRELKYLTSLDLSLNRLTDVSFLRELKSLTSLNLSSARLTDVSFLRELKSLTSLNLGSNRLTDVSFLRELKSLTSLNLSSARLTDVSFLRELKSLTSLNLSRNQLKEIPEHVKELKSLYSLKLRKNQIKEIPEFLSNLYSLTNLDLTNNLITTIPEVIINWNIDITFQNDNSINGIKLSGNPIQFPPLAVIKNFSRIELRQYLKQYYQQGQKYLYEGKIIVLGEPGSGKTTLVQRLINQNDLHNNSMTHGININEWKFTFDTDNLKTMTANIWDFGGQEILYSTYQLFLTPNALYILVLDSRSEDSNSEFWFNTINNYDQNSPIIVVLNDKYGHRINFDDNKFKRLIPNRIIVTVTVNLSSTEKDIGFEQLTKLIQAKLINREYPIIPTIWLEAKEYISSLKSKYDFISIEEFSAICVRYGLDQKNAILLSIYLHNIGSIMHFQDNPELKRVIYINCDLVLKSIYKVFGNHKIGEQQGRFTIQDLTNLNGIDRIKESEIVSLLKMFNLCYEISHGNYLLPALLPTNELSYDWRTYTNNLHIQYHYSFMPADLISRFIVTMNSYIYNNILWRNGVLLELDDARALVKVDYSKKKLHIIAEGGEKEELVSQILTVVNEIHKTYKYINIKQYISCNCSGCKNNQEPYMYAYEKLEKYQEKSKTFIECQLSFQDVNIKSLFEQLSPNAISYSNLGDYYLSKNENDKANDYYQKSLRMLSELESKDKTQPPNQFKIDLLNRINLLEHFKIVQKKVINYNGENKSLSYNNFLKISKNYGYLEIYGYSFDRMVENIECFNIPIIEFTQLLKSIQTGEKIEFRTYCIFSKMYDVDDYYYREIRNRDELVQKGILIIKLQLINEELFIDEILFNPIEKGLSWESDSFEIRHNKEMDEYIDKNINEEYNDNSQIEILGSEANKKKLEFQDISRVGSGEVAEYSEINELTKYTEFIERVNNHNHSGKNGLFLRLDERYGCFCKYSDIDDEGGWLGYFDYYYVSKRKFIELIKSLMMQGSVYFENSCIYSNSSSSHDQTYRDTDYLSELVKRGKVTAHLHILNDKLHIDDIRFISIDEGLSWNIKSVRAGEDHSKEIKEYIIKYVNEEYSDSFNDFDIKNYWHFILYDSTVGREDLENNCLRLWDGPEEKGLRSTLIQEIKKDDLIFIYSRGFGYIGIAIADGTGEQKINESSGGYEGIIKVKKLVLLEDENCVQRDVPRLKTLQRILDINELLNRFIIACEKNQAEVKFLKKLQESIKIEELETGEKRESSILKISKSALVIGISDYDHIVPVPSCVNDAEDVATALRKLGFSVMLETNPTLIEFEDALESFSQSIKINKGMALFYYSGHGIQVAGKNYLVPKNAQLDKELRIKRQTINLEEIMDTIRKGRNDPNILMIDACQDNPFSGRSHGLSDINILPSNTCLFFSASPDMIAFEGGKGKRNGIFTDAFLKELEENPYEELDKIFRKTYISVRQKTNDKQKPWTIHNLSKKCYFIETKEKSLNIIIDSGEIEKLVNEKKETNYLYMLDALKLLVEKAEGKEKIELRAKQKEFIKQVKKIIALEIENDNEKYASAIQHIEKTNKEIESAVKDVNRISQVLNSLTNTMNIIGEFV